METFVKTKGNLVHTGEHFVTRLTSMPGKRLRQTSRQPCSKCNSSVSPGSLRHSKRRTFNVMRDLPLISNLLVLVCASNFTGVAFRGFLTDPNKPIKLFPLRFQVPYHCLFIYYYCFINVLPHLTCRPATQQCRFLFIIINNNKNIFMSITWFNHMMHHISQRLKSSFT